MSLLILLPLFRKKKMEKKKKFRGEKKKKGEDVRNPVTLFGATENTPGSEGKGDMSKGKKKEKKSGYRPWVSS